ncbi:glycoside hydrolase domain-containing protein [Clostridium tyrobutyricum]|uniref:glycoside hydrolase domain-containing protein n=4 Tax=Clostridium tyrobutyricum TaxID=1519 RepID=UPI00242CCFC5|nr:glycoside hydrolase domain-containing protein [Clostridium tyrobutyricum]
MDQMVLEVQEWLNNTYGSNSNYTPITADGITGGGTVAALITALQIELGIQPADGVFGAATQAACPTLPNTSASKNEVYILQGALYCKGYNPNGFDGGYGNGVITAIKKFQSDAGLTTQDGITTPMIFKALLNTDAYVLISGGDTNIRTIQQNLNRDYNSVIGLIPSNGVYSRSTNTALIKAVQHEEGNSTDGIWGSTTQAGCPTIPGTNATKNFILLLQYSLYCNGYNPNGFDGLYGNGLKTAIINFQQFVGLTADGYAGSQTWASLLVSTGDPNRKGTACDCSTTITAEKAATLKANGYEIVGRYLTGIYAMTHDELETIFANNLKVVPIFEVGGYNLIYFTSSQGVSDANSAIAAANNLGFPDGTIIYFTVDFDALDINVTNAIIPYFKAIKNTFTELGSKYNIGIYAPRNVCSRIANAGYSCSSFVCDMSSGFSGNLGYTLPQDWAFDQIHTISLGSGSGHIEIDNDISSGKNNGVSQIAKIILLLKRLDSAAETYLVLAADTYDLSSRNTLVYNYLRSLRYTGYAWLLTLGPNDLGFIEYLKQGESDLVNEITPYIQNDNTLTAYIHNKGTDLPHLSATTLGYNRLVLDHIVPDFWTGWGGDVATAMADLTDLKNKPENVNRSLDELAVEIIGSTSYSCSRMDIENDIDAIYLAEKIKDNKVGNLIDEYFSTVDGLVRRNILLNNLGLTGITIHQLNSKIYDIMTGDDGFRKKIGGSSLLSLATTKEGIKPTSEIEQATTLAFSKYILNTL